MRGAGRSAGGRKSGATESRSASVLSVMQGIGKLDIAGGRIVQCHERE